MNLEQEDILLLIQEYQKYRLLWDPKDKWHFNKAKKHDAWTEISKAVNIDIEDANKKISSLLGSFRREKSKGKKTVGTGKETKEVYRSNWFAFKSFAFLMDKDEVRSTIASEENTNDEAPDSPLHEQEADEHSFKDNSSDNTEEIIADNDASVNKESTSVTKNSTKKRGAHSFTKPTTPKKKRCKQSRNDSLEEDPRIQKAYEVLLQQPIEQETSTTLFSKYMATKLDQFDPRTRAVLIHKIQQLIFETELALSGTTYYLPTRNSEPSHILSSITPSLQRSSTPAPVMSPSSCSSSYDSIVTTPTPSPNNYANHDSPLPPATSFDQSDNILGQLQEFVNLG